METELSTHAVDELEIPAIAKLATVCPFTKFNTEAVGAFCWQLDPLSG